MLSNREGLGGGGVGAINILRTFEGREERVSFKS